MDGDIGRFVVQAEAGIIPYKYNVEITLFLHSGEGALTSVDIECGCLVVPSEAYDGRLSVYVSVSVTGILVEFIFGISSLRTSVRVLPCFL